MNYPEDELIPISVLQHILFCPRRSALVHLECIWAENRFTVAGVLSHEKTDTAGSEQRSDLRIGRALKIRSLELGITGQADVVEFHRLPDGSSEGVALLGADGKWRPFPVEYKSGKLRHEVGYEVQLCAQALCLEEMLGTTIPEGAIWYGKSKRRKEVKFDVQLRRATHDAIAQARCLLIENRETPPARYEPKCDSCSLIDMCMPKAVGRHGSASRYVQHACSGTSEEESGD